MYYIIVILFGVRCIADSFDLLSHSFLSVGCGMGGGLSPARLHSDGERMGRGTGSCPFGLI
jgi:hypothetical protein